MSAVCDGAVDMVSSGHCARDKSQVAASFTDIPPGLLGAEERLVSSGSRVRVPVIVTSDSDTKLDSDLAPCSVLVVVMVQSDTPLDVENEEILLSSSSTDLPTEIVIGNNKQS